MLKRKMLAVLITAVVTLPIGTAAAAAEDCLTEESVESFSNNLFSEEEDLFADALSEEPLSKESLSEESLSEDSLPEDVLFEDCLAGEDGSAGEEYLDGVDVFVGEDWSAGADAADADSFGELFEEDLNVYAELPEEEDLNAELPEEEDLNATLPEEEDLNAELPEEEDLNAELPEEEDPSAEALEEEDLYAEITEEHAASAISLNAEECTIYTFGTQFFADHFKTMPSGYPMSFQLRIYGTDEKPRILIREGNAVHYDDNLVFSAPVGYGYSESAVYDVYVGGKTLTFTVHVKNYPEIYASQLMDQWIAENLDESMTQVEKAEAIVRHVAEDYGYDDRYASAESMLIAGAGDCWGSTDIICSMCRKIGIDARWRSASIDGGAGSGHVNASMKIGDTYYIGEAGFDEPKPRKYSFHELEEDNLFVTRRVTDDTVKIVQYNGFEDEVTIPETIDGCEVVSIGYRCFSRSNNHTNLKTVHLPASVTRIEEEAFYLCEAMETFSVPATVTSIDEAAFRNMTSLKEFKVEAGNPSYKVVNKSLYTADGKTLIAVPTAWEGEHTVCDGCKRIGTDAFYNTSKITQIHFPASLREIGVEAFSLCGAKSIYLPEGVTTIEDLAFGSNDLLDLSIPSTVKTVGYHALSSYKVRILSMDAEYDETAIVGIPLVMEGSTAQTLLNRLGRSYTLLDENGQIPLEEDWFISSAWSTYDGTPQTDVWNKTTDKAPYFMLKGYDYTISFENNIHAGTAWIVWTGCGFFTGSVKQPFTIGPEWVNTEDVVNIQCEDPIYRGTPVKTQITVKDHEGRTLTEGKDYTVTVSGNNAPGTMTVEVTCCGNYQGSYIREFDLSDGREKPDDGEHGADDPGSDPNTSPNTNDSGSNSNFDDPGNNQNNVADGHASTTGATTTDGSDAGATNNSTFSAKARTIAAPKGKITKGKTTKVKTAKVKIAKVKITKVKRKKKAISLNWKKVKNADGYEIQYALNKKFTKKAKTITVSSKKNRTVIRKLKTKKKYYVRIRAYTIKNGVYIAGKWSKTKTVKTK